MTQTFEISKQYRENAKFITLIFDDPFITQGLRAAIETISNDEFPEVFGGNNNEQGYKSLKEF